MKQGTKVELPLWLGEMLAVRCIIPPLLVRSGVALTCAEPTVKLSTRRHWLRWICQLRYRSG